MRKSLIISQFWQIWFFGLVQTGHIKSGRFITSKAIVIANEISNRRQFLKLAMLQ
jgi:hypothetical protein